MGARGGEPEGGRCGRAAAQRGGGGGEEEPGVRDRVLGCDGDLRAGKQDARDRGAVRYSRGAREKGGGGGGEREVARDSGTDGEVGKAEDMPEVSYSISPASSAVGKNDVKIGWSCNGVSGTIAQDLSFTVSE